MTELSRSALLEILYQSLLLIRANCSKRDVVHALANHSHNIPRLVQNPSPELLLYYWEVERPCFLHHAETLGFRPNCFEESWLIIEEECKILKSNESQ